MTMCKGYGPDCFGSFLSAGNFTYADLVSRYLAKGYDHCLTAASSSPTGVITCGDEMSEYRHLSRPALFFKGEPPLWEVLVKGQYCGADPVVIVEYRKFYSNMSSIGRALCIVEFSGEELAEWIAFWEKQEVSRGPLRGQLQESSVA